MDEKKDRKAEQKRTGAIDPKRKKKDMPSFETEDGQKIFIMVDETQKMAKGGRARLKGGGICKKGMNRKAVGKNS